MIVERMCRKLLQQAESSQTDCSEGTMPYRRGRVTPASAATRVKMVSSVSHHISFG